MPPTTRATPVHIRYPAELPVIERKDELLAAIRDHQVVIVAGETGSGKSTQLPKLCLELGRGVDDVGRDQVQAITDAVDELAAEGPGDVLVFLSGEREIRDTADALRALELRHTEILPLYARLTSAEQHQVFQPHTGRRIVL